MENPEKESPPFGGSWQRWYLAVLLALFLQILVYHWVTQKYSWAL